MAVDFSTPLFMLSLPNLREMAYAALSSLKHTLEQLLQPNPRLDISGSKQLLESIYQILCFLQAFLEDTNIPPKEVKDIETMKILEKKMRDAVCKAEDAVDSSLRSIIIAVTRRILQEMACQVFNETLQKVEKEVASLRKEVSTTRIEFSNKQAGMIEYKQGIRTCTSSENNSTIDENSSVVVGMEDDLHTLRDRLTTQTSELTVVSVLGMAGIGKTTLARKIYDDSLIRHRFDTCVWVTVSEEYNERQVLLDTVLSISPDRTRDNIREISNDRLAEIVYRGLIGRRYLIVIDDLWNTEAWDQMQRIYPDDNNKSRILLTTRLKYVAEYASPDYPPHTMSFLSLDGSWILFSKRLFRKDPCPPQLDEIGKHIIQHCRGLPLSIVVIAGLLGKMEASLDCWKRVEENLNSFFATVSEQCQAILSLSYSYLPQYLKACFLYVGGFPEDMEIGVSKLTSLWIAEQFVKERNHKRLEVVAEEYLEELIQRSLILVGKRGANGRIKTCKIHDLLRHLCIREAQIENVMHVINDSIPNFSQGISYQRRVIVPVNIAWESGDHLCPGRGIKSTTRSLVFMRTCHLNTYGPNGCPIVSHLKLLKVLDVSSVKHDFSTVIPQLVHLRFVAANVDKRIPSSLSNLWNLQTMILRNLREEDYLPVEVWTLSHIRHLDIGSLLVMPVLCDTEDFNYGEQPLFLNNLQTLVLRFSYRVKEILRNTPNLNKLSLWIKFDSEWFGLLDSLVLLEGLEILNITANFSYQTRFRIPPGLVFPYNLKHLRLTRTFLPWEDMILLATLPNLEVLKIDFDFERKTADWSLTEEVVFRKLKFLRVIREKRICLLMS